MHILCLSNGGADGLGAVRTKELETVKEFLGIASLDVVDDPQMRDGFDQRWPEEVVASHVQHAVQQVGTDGKCSPCHRMQFNSRNEGSKCAR